MTLQVPFEGFAHAAGHVAGAKEAYVWPHPSGGSIATCADAVKGVHVFAAATHTAPEAKAILEEAGLKVIEGLWTEEAVIDVEGDPLDKSFVAAVSYLSDDQPPGLWVDCYPELPTHISVLRAMYQEFRDTGELGEVTFEEFIRLANPNVVVVSATELRGYLQSKE